MWACTMISQIYSIYFSLRYLQVISLHDRKIQDTYRNHLSSRQNGKYFLTPVYREERPPGKVFGLPTEWKPSLVPTCNKPKEQHNLLPFSLKSTTTIILVSHFASLSVVVFLFALLEKESSFWFPNAFFFQYFGGQTE